MPLDASGGLDLRLHGAAANSASELTNVRWASDLGGMWSSDLGWEPLVPDANAAGRLFHPSEFTPCRLLVPWSSWLLTEYDGVLAWRWWNRGTGAVGSERTVLATGRYIAPGNAPSTVAIDCGPFVLLVNGHDAPLKWWGGSRVTPFGFAVPPSAPSCTASDPEYWLETPTALATWQASSPSLGFPALPLPLGANDVESALGLGLTGGDKVSSYDYVRTWVSDTGSESPPSPRATVRWQQPPTATLANKRRLGVFVDLAGGPANAVGHRLYRTGNRRQGDASESAADSTLYLCASVAYGGDVDWTDALPDQAVVGQPSPPSVLEAAVLPTGVRAGAMWDGRLWLTDGARLFWSERAELERFPATNVVELSVALGVSGAEAVTLTAAGGSLVVFLRSGVAVVLPSTSPTAASPYQIVTVTSAAGSGLCGINAATWVPSVGLMWVGVDGLVWMWSGDPAQQPMNTLSAPIHRVLSRASVGALASAWACYVPSEQEVWFHLPVDGEVLPTLGVVLHLEAGAWSTRGWHTLPGSADASGVAGVSRWRSCFTVAATAGDGRLLLGCGAYNALGDVAPGELPASRAAGDLLYNVGVAVWGRGSGWGRLLTGWAAVAVGGETWWSSATRSDGSSDGARWASAWWLPDEVETGSMRRGLKVGLSVIGAGVRAARLYSGLDGVDGVWTDEATSLLFEDGDFPASGSTEQYDRVFQAPAGASAARDGVWGTALVTNTRMVRVVRDLSVSAGMRRRLRVGVRTLPSNVAPSAWMGLAGLTLVVENKAEVARGIGRTAGAGGGSP